MMSGHMKCLPVGGVLVVTVYAYKDASKQSKDKKIAQDHERQFH